MIGSFCTHVNTMLEQNRKPTVAITHRSTLCQSLISLFYFSTSVALSMSNWVSVDPIHPSPLYSSLSCPTTSPVWHCSVQLKDERMIRHLLQQVGKQTVQRKSGDEGRDQAWGHSPYGGPVLRPGMCLYRPQAQLIKPTSDPMWWPLGHSMT